MEIGGKDRDLSDRLRAEGNTFYKKGLNKQALQKYYLALDSAPQDSTSFFQAMCNIAVTLVNLGFPEYAELHLKRILNNKDKLENMKQVENLQKKMDLCPKASNSKLFVPPSQKLYNGANELYPQVSGAVRVAYNKDRGRHLIACEDIPAGSVVVLERPTLLITTRDSTNCSHCCRILPLSYIPCEICDTRFCNEECRKAGAHFHRMIRHTSYVPDHSTVDLAARVIMQYTRKELAEGLEAPPNRRDVCVSFDDTSFAALMTLQQRSYADHDATLSKAAAAILQIEKFKEKMGYDQEAYNDIANRNFVMYALKSIVGRIELNAHLIYHDPCEWVVGKHVASRMLIDAGIAMEDSFNTRRIDLLKTSKTAGDVVAVCLLPVVSVANHSCVPNLITSFADADERCIVVRTSRNVFAGEELLHNYGPVLGLHNYETRRIRLQNDFGFTCHCEACAMKGSHPIDRRLSCRMCCFCHADFLPHHPSDFRCRTCAGDKSNEAGYRELQKELCEVDASLEVDCWNWDSSESHEKAFCIFEKALGIYYIGNRRLEEFAVEACMAAMKAGYYEYADNYVHFLSELRKLVFSGRYCPFLANASLILAVFDIIRMKNVEKMRVKSRLREVKKNINLARSIFNKIYGQGSVRDRELDLLLQKAAEFVSGTSVS